MGRIRFKMDNLALVAVLLMSIFGNGDSDIVTQDDNLMVNNEFKIGQPLHITCSRNAVGNFNDRPDNDVITKISLMWQSGDDAAVPLASYSPSNPFGNYRVIQSVAERTGWSFTMDGSNEVTSFVQLNANVDSIQLALIIANPVCNDAGVFSCEFEYYQNQVDASSPFQQNVTAGVTNDEVIFSQSLNLNPPQYDIGTNMTFDCRLDGPLGMKLVWQTKQCDDDFGTDYSFQTYIGPGVTDTNGDDPQSSCQKKRYATQLKQFAITEFICGVRCAAGLAGNALTNEVNVVSSSNSTIIPIDPNAGNTGAASAGAGGDDTGAIVGGLIGGLVAIAIIVFLVWFFVIRKKKDAPEDKYKESEEGNNSVDHAPPPVFYTKPTKPGAEDKDHTTGVHNPALDTSYDSRDSRGSRPPRYVNTDPAGGLDAQPRGRVNRSYDEDNNRSMDRSYDDDGNGTAPRDRPQYRRKDRSERRNRNHSTDDGTDNRSHTSYNSRADGYGSDKGGRDGYSRGVVGDRPTTGIGMDGIGDGDPSLGTAI